MLFYRVTKYSQREAEKMEQKEEEEEKEKEEEEEKEESKELTSNNDELKGANGVQMGVYSRVTIWHKSEEKTEDRRPNSAEKLIDELTE